MGPDAAVPVPRPAGGVAPPAGDRGDPRGPRLGEPRLTFGSVTSTQDVCRRLGDAGAPEGTLVVADHQTAGRGRRGRAWADVPGRSLLCSVLLRPALPPERWPQLTLAAGCAVAEALEAAAGATPRLRWPNDVLLDGRKVAGILAEAFIGPSPFLVLGIGINLAQHDEEWPPHLRGRAVSLAAAGHEVPRDRLLAALLRRLEAWYARLAAEGFAPVRAAWRRRGVFGGPVRAEGRVGVAVDLAPEGGLLVRYPDGTTTILRGGEAMVEGPGSGCP